MVYLYKKIIGKKPYYYLRASERKGEKVVAKDIAYLGSSIKDVKKSLEELSQHKDSIRKAYKKIHTVLESNHYLEKILSRKIKKNVSLGDNHSKIEACKLHYRTDFRKLKEETKRETWKNFIVEFAFNTASIEGNTITLQEARNLLVEGLSPKNRTLREIYDLQNTEKTFFAQIHKRQKVSHELITSIHSELMEKIDSRTGYRKADVRVFKATFKSTPAPYVKTDMDLLLKWFNTHETKLHPFVLAVVFHHKFEKIHPFMDGNGRTGRMILNHILMKFNYPPLIISKKFRPQYLETLHEADRVDLTKFSIDGYGQLIKFAADEMTNHYWNLFL